MSFFSHYWVEPKAGHDYLPLQVLLDRIRAAFPKHIIDADKGRIDTELRLSALTRFGAPDAILQSYRYPGVYCYLFDDIDESRQIEFMIWPLQGIGVSFATKEHERSAKHLLDRLAESLDGESERDDEAS